ncbi:MAG: hypothetical protein M1530_04415 [Candidatus Marsarchaeota archaeon]|nr:hypothetical protein [Candidatus Marsarchaeota archaeon]
MTEAEDTRAAYVLAAGLLLAVLAWQFKWLTGAPVIAFAIAPAAAVCGYHILQSWRKEAGREHIEPLLHYAVLVAAAWGLIGWLFARSGWTSQMATLLSAALLLPPAIDWLLERTTLRGSEPEPEMAVDE